MKYSPYIKPRKRNSIIVELPKTFYIKKAKILLFSLLPYIFVILVIFISYILLSKTSILNLEADSVEIYGAGTFVNEREFKNKLYELVVGKNILKIKSSDIKDALLRDFPSIKSITINKKIPPHLVVNVFERSPYFAIYSDDISKSYLVTKDGYILGDLSEKYKDLFKVQYTEPFEVGGYVDATILDLYKEILKEIDAVNLVLDHVSFTKDSISVVLSNKVEVLLPNKNSVQNYFKIVSSILDRYKDDTKKVTKIDLRFEKVIVSYN